MHSTSRPSVNYDRCTGCARCVKWCQVNAINIQDDSRAHIDEELCTGCSMCISVCPFNAIRINWNTSSEFLNTKITEYAHAVTSRKKNKMFYVTFLNNITRLCDCVNIHGEHLVPDIGILFSKDIVAIDRASIDLVNKKVGKNLFKELYPNIQWENIFFYAEKLSMGSSDYELVEVK